jgi:hypothetical protein
MLLFVGADYGPSLPQPFVPRKIGAEKFPATNPQSFGLAFSAPANGKQFEAHTLFSYLHLHIFASNPNHVHPIRSLTVERV